MVPLVRPLLVFLDQLQIEETDGQKEERDNHQSNLVIPDPRHCRLIAEIAQCFSSVYTLQRNTAGEERGEGEGKEERGERGEGEGET